MGFTSSQLATASLIGQVGGAASSAIGSYYGAASSKANLNAQATMAESNARLAEMSAQSALNQGQKQVGQITLQAGQLKSRQRANLAANGIDLGVGNAAELQASTEIMSQIDANTTEANSVRTAWGIRTQGVNFQNEALTKRATAGAISPGSSMVSSLMGSAGSVAGSWYSMKQAGMFNTPQAGNYQVGTPGYSGHYLQYDP